MEKLFALQTVAALFDYVEADGFQKSSKKEVNAMTIQDEVELHRKLKKSHEVLAESHPEKAVRTEHRAMARAHGEYANKLAADGAGKVAKVEEDDFFSKFVYGGRRPEEGLKPLARAEDLFR